MKKIKICGKWNVEDNGDGTFNCKECDNLMQSKPESPKELLTCPKCGTVQDYACYSCGERHPFASPTAPEGKEEYEERMYQQKLEWEAKQLKGRK